MKATIIFAILFLVSVGSVADDISAEDKAKAQLTLAQWMKARADDTGRFVFVDRQSNELVGGYSANVHTVGATWEESISAFTWRGMRARTNRNTRSTRLPGVGMSPPPLNLAPLWRN